MAEQRRRTDSEDYRKYRPDRFSKAGSEWYFTTREGTLEGPYRSRTDAEAGLNTYIKLMASGFMPKDATLSIEPLEEATFPESPPLH